MIGTKLFVGERWDRPRVGIRTDVPYGEAMSIRGKVCAGIEFFTARLFGRHVRDGADGASGIRQVILIDDRCGYGGGSRFGRRSWSSQFRQPEIENLCLASLGHKQVRGFQVAVHDSRCMRDFERVGHLDTDVEYELKRDGPRLDAMLQRAEMTLIF